MDPLRESLLLLTRRHFFRNCAVGVGSSCGVTPGVNKTVAIADAGQLIARAAAHRRPGPSQLQAAIVACHAEAERWEDTDWEQIELLYSQRHER